MLRRRALHAVRDQPYDAQSVALTLLLLRSDSSIGAKVRCAPIISQRAPHPEAEQVTAAHRSNHSTDIPGAAGAPDMTLKSGNPCAVVGFAVMFPVGARRPAGHSTGGGTPVSRDCKRVLFLSAFVVLHDSASRTYYDRKRVEGKKHTAAHLPRRKSLRCSLRHAQEP